MQRILFIFNNRHNNKNTREYSFVLIRNQYIYIYAIAEKSSSVYFINKAIFMLQITIEHSHNQQ